MGQMGSPRFRHRRQYHTQLKDVPASRLRVGPETQACHPHHLPHRLQVSSDQCGEEEAVLQGRGGTEMKEHEVTMEFFKEIDPEKSKFAVRPREVSFVLEKVEEGPYWDRLLESKLKQHWLKIDYKNWVDEDEEEEPGQGQDLEEMMRQMGGLGGAGAQAGGVGAAEMGDMTKKAYQRPTLDDLDIEEEEDEDDMPDLE